MKQEENSKDGKEKKEEKNKTNSSFFSSHFFSPLKKTALEKITLEKLFQSIGLPAFLSTWINKNINKNIDKKITEKTKENLKIQSSLTRDPQTNIQREIEVFLKKSSVPIRLISLLEEDSEFRTTFLYTFMLPYFRKLTLENPLNILNIYPFLKGKSKAEFKQEIHRELEEFKKKKYDRLTLKKRTKPSHLSFHLSLYQKQEGIRIAFREILGHSSSTESEKELSELAESFLLELFFFLQNQQQAFEAEQSIALFAVGDLATWELSYESPLQFLWIYDQEENPKELYKMISFTEKFLESFARLSYPLKIPLQYPSKAKKGQSSKFLYSKREYLQSIEKELQTLPIRFLTGSKEIAESFLEELRVHKKNLFSFELDAVQKYIRRNFLLLESDLLFCTQSLVRFFLYFSNSSHLNPFIVPQIVPQDNIPEEENIVDKNIQDFMTLLEVWLKEEKRISEKEKEAIKHGIPFLKGLKHRLEFLNHAGFFFYCLSFNQLEELTQLMQDSVENILSEYESLSQTIESILKRLFPNPNTLSMYSSDLLPSLKDFHNPHKAERLLEEMKPKSLYHSVSFYRFMKEFLPKITKCSDPDSILVSFLQFFQSYFSKERFFEFLVQNSSFMQQSMEIFCHGSFLSQILIQNPWLIEDILSQPKPISLEKKIQIEVSQLFQSKKKTEQKIKKKTHVRQATTETIQKKEQERFAELAHSLRQLKSTQSFFIGMDYVLEKKSLREIFSELSELAEKLLEHSLDFFISKELEELAKEVNEGSIPFSKVSQKEHIHSKELKVKKPKAKKLKDPEIAPLAVLMLGKLGGKELGFGSDLDLIFITQDHKKPEESHDSVLFYTQVLHKFHEFFSKLYTIDLNLRPEGKNAPIVQSLSSFQKYLKNKAGHWERLAYTKTRILTQDQGFKKDLEKTLKNFLLATQSPKNFLTEVLEIRDKIFRHTQKQYPQSHSFKRTEGALLDLEFLVQILWLFHIFPNPSQKNTRSTCLFDMLADLRKKQILTKSDTQTIEKSVLFFREIDHRLFILSAQSSEILPKDSKDIARELNFSNKTEFFKVYFQTKHRSQKLFEQYIQKLRESQSS